MTIDYSVLEQDYIHFNIDHYNNAKNLEVTRIVYSILPVVVFLLLSLAMYRFILPIKSLIIACVLGLIWIPLYPKIVDSSIKKMAIKYIKGGKANDFIGKQRLTLGDGFIECSNSSMTTQITYSSVERIDFGHGLYYIYVGAVKAIIIPAAAFSGEEHKDMFFSLLSQKTGYYQTVLG